MKKSSILSTVLIFIFLYIGYGSFQQYSYTKQNILNDKTDWYLSWCLAVKPSQGVSYDENHKLLFIGWALLLEWNRTADYKILSMPSSIIFPTSLSRFDDTPFIWNTNKSFEPEKIERRQISWPRTWIICTYLSENGKEVSPICYGAIGRRGVKSATNNKAYILREAGHTIVGKSVANKFQSYGYSQDYVKSPVISDSGSILYVWSKKNIQAVYMEKYSTLQTYDDISYYDFFPNSNDFFFLWRDKNNNSSFVVCKNHYKQ